MNLFRSEEHAKNWKKFQEGTEAGILPAEGLAQAFSIGFFTRRLEPDYVAKVGDYVAELIQSVSGLGPFWQIEG
jgi:hypothetical protein